MGIHVGDLGTAATELRPQGFVTVGGERMDARSAHGVIRAGTVVAVVAGDHLGLVVREVAGDRLPELPDHGRPVLASFADRVDAEAERAEAGRREWLVRHRRLGHRVTAAVGAAAAAAACAWVWDLLPAWRDEPLLTAAALTVAGGLLGVLAFRLLDDAVGEAEPGFRRVTTLSTSLGLVGAIGTAAGCVPLMSLPAAATAGLLAGLLLAAVPLGVVAQCGGGGGGGDG